jgi:hypothetical protein
MEAGVEWRRVVVARKNGGKRDVYYYPVPNTDERLNEMLMAAGGGRKLRSARDVLRLRAHMYDAGKGRYPRRRRVLFLWAGCGACNGNGGSVVAIFPPTLPHRLEKRKRGRQR